MAKANAPFTAFNHGEIGRETINRPTLEIYPHTAALMENFMPEVSGVMHHRPGLEFLSGIGMTPIVAWRFQFSASLSFSLLIDATRMRIANASGVIVREAVGCTLGDGSFLAGDWTDTTEASTQDGSSPALPTTSASSSTGGSSGPPETFAGSD